jgi:hypothetical protein
MKKFLLVSLLYLISFSLLAQKATVQLIQIKNTGLSDWQILDDQNVSLFSGTGNVGNDSSAFSLEANKYYFLRVSVTEINYRDTSLYSLILNGEPILLIKTGIGIGDHLFPFFTGVKALNAKIAGGTNALISDFPWQVYFISGNFRCGGSIINGNWILTAAHCTKDDFGAAIPASSMSVKVGANNPSNTLDGKIYQVSADIVNEGYNDQTLLNDIALLRLKDTINFTNATPINIVTANDVTAGAITPGVLSWVTGWGYTSVSPDVLPTALQKVQLPIISNAQAASVWGTKITATDLMAGYLNGNKDACNGDSGGPLIVPVSGEYRLAGLVSWGSPSCNTYGAYSRVSDFDDWILKNTGFLPKGDSIVCKGTASSQYSIIPIPGASKYQWSLLPVSAGTINGSGRNTTVLWNTSFTGNVTIILSATINNKISDWYRLSVKVATHTKLLSQSADTVICAGQHVSLNVNVLGYNLIYKWSKNGQVIQTGSSSKINISSATINDSGDYSCEISGSCGTDVSGNIKLTVYPVTKITFISPNVEVPFGNDVTLQVNADGHDLVYQWQKNGMAIANSNSSLLLLSQMNASNTGIYRTTVTGTCGIETSDSIYVYVKRSSFKGDPEVFVWPTITNNEFEVALSTDSFYNVQIFNTMGKKIRDLPKCRYQTSINISTLDQGVYIIEVYNSDFRKSIKVIKE